MSEIAPSRREWDENLAGGSPCLTHVSLIKSRTLRAVRTKNISPPPVVRALNNSSSPRVFYPVTCPPPPLPYQFSPRYDPLMLMSTPQLCASNLSRFINSLVRDLSRLLSICAIAVCTYVLVVVLPAVDRREDG